MKEQIFPLTSMQVGMVFHQLVDAHTGVDIEQIVLRLPLGVDFDGLVRAWQAVIDHHPELRSDIVAMPNGDYGVRQLPSFAIPHTATDLRGSADASADLEQLLDEDRLHGFEIFSGVPQRLMCVQLPVEDLCVWTFHHLLIDGRNFANLLNEILSTYDGEVHTFAEPPSRKNYLDWLAEQPQAPSRNYWTELLQDLPQRDSLVGPGSTGTERGSEAYTFSKADTDQLAALARQCEITLNTLVQTVWSILVARHSGSTSAVFGNVRAGRAGSVPGADDMLGVFINTVPMRMDLDGVTVAEALTAMRRQQINHRAHEHISLSEIEKMVGSEQPLFESLLLFDREILDAAVKKLRPDWQDRSFELRERTPYPLTVYAYAEPTLSLKLAFDPTRLSRPLAQRMLQHLRIGLESLAANLDAQALDLPFMPDSELRIISDAQTGGVGSFEATSINQQFESCAHERPGETALVAGSDSISYADLDRLAGAVASELRRQGVAVGDVVGVSVRRSIDMVAAILGILKTGAAYLPLDPDYPTERQKFCLKDAQAKLVLTDSRLAYRFEGGDIQVLTTDAFSGWLDTSAGEFPAVDASQLAYLIYTSGSTGQPKGVMLEHRSVLNFFAAMDTVITVQDRKVWLAVTSISFDISVLELLWTLTRGFTVVLHGVDDSDKADQMSFSLFYFANEPLQGDRDLYRLVLEGAKFADRHGFEAVWTPERHFHAFGGMYPNPSVIGAAIAATTEHVHIRAGSCVLPLHNPLRVAEEWSVVDNISEGRVGIAFASGWQPNDFVLAPENYAQRNEVMYAGIETVRKLWRGESVNLENAVGDSVPINTLPRPVQQELPVWITTAGSPQTWEQAGRIGANILTHLLGQTVEELGEKVALYRNARSQAGLDPLTGRVTLMLHTFVGPDAKQVKTTVKEPMKEYLRGSASLVGQYADAWTAYKQGEQSGTVAASALEDLDANEMAQLLDFAFERYFESSGLFGTPSSCIDLVEAIASVGISEIACLIDFGVDTDTVLAHLPYINEIREQARSKTLNAGRTLVEDLVHHDVTHLQCTPSLARMIPMQVASNSKTSGEIKLEELLIGGEALPEDLVKELFEVLPNAQIHNMYGPTETTIWSTTKRMEPDVEVTIGQPILNTQCYVLDPCGRSLPLGRVGELYIGGAGVARGYHNRDELTSTRFAAAPFAPKERLYATGDLVQLLENHDLRYIGRVDDQVKVRGHRIELGEIELAIRSHECIADAVVVTRADHIGMQQLICYFVADTEVEAPDNTSLRQYLRQTLPDYMLPNKIVQLDALPLTPNGKVDRNALPAPEQAPNTESKETLGASTDLQERIATLWQQVLGLDDVSIRSNFFDLGGHSILAVKLQALLVRELERDIHVTELFRYPTIESFAAHLGQSATASTRSAQSTEQGSTRGKRRRQKRRGQVS